mmetsp:Transcript_4248/g.9244  ORF Transcript_4248/g.9244 Transcript_4248/m.9244 type:complete len:287 (+) Transcript_4248:78-938(+)
MEESEDTRDVAWEGETGARSTSIEEASTSHKEPASSRPHSERKNSPSRGASRPTSPKRLVYRPDSAYNEPPAQIQRLYNGVGEGQLLYQIGKFAPLIPTYAPSWVRDPPQRPAVTDLRLAPSQRSQSCYSPEFLDFCCTGSRPSTAYTHQSTSSSSSRGSSRATSRAARLYSRPTTSLPNPAQLPATPLSQYIKEQARSSFETGGIFIPSAHPTQMPMSTLIKHAAKVVNNSRLQTRVASEGTMVSPARSGHHPPPTEVQLRLAVAMSHEHAAPLPYRKRLQAWGR